VARKEEVADIGIGIVGTTLWIVVGNLLAPRLFARREKMCFS
jgi:hypothetical protein